MTIEGFCKVAQELYVGYLQNSFVLKLCTTQNSTKAIKYNVCAYKWYINDTVGITRLLVYEMPFIYFSNSMTKFLVRSIFLAFIFFQVGFVQSYAHSFQLDTNSPGTPALEEYSHGDEEPSADESLDLPSPLHGNGKDLCLPLVERAEEQELEHKSFKKKLDCNHDASPMSWTLSIYSLFFVNKNLSSLEWLHLSTTTTPRYLRFRNLRS